MDLFGSSFSISPGMQIFLLVLQLWTIFWKAFALWRSARSNQRYWFVAFIALLPLNDLGIVELVYLFRFAKNRLTIDEVKGWFSSLQKKSPKKKK